MSNFERWTMHPMTERFEKAIWIDNYFGRHHYGVRFPSSRTIYKASDFSWQFKEEDSG